jgi:putative membrane protein insertion efficiency factor
MRRLSIFLIQCYKAILSPFMGNNCRFYPSCATYAEEAITSHGVIKGSGLAIRRLSKCHPWHEGGIDLVPPCPHSH